MPTKLRSACDKCHETKVRCSGDVPCQSCLTSGSLCFYSLSDPLGRPKGTKKTQARRESRTHGDDAWERDDRATGDATVTRAGSDRGSNKRPSHRRSLYGRESRSSASKNIPGSSGLTESTSTTMSSGGLASGDNPSFHLTHQSQNNIDISGFEAPNEFTLSSSTSAGDGVRSLSDTLSHGFQYNDIDSNAMADIARSEFNSLTNSGARSPLMWDDTAFNNDRDTFSNALRTSAENLEFPSTVKGYLTTQSTVIDPTLSCATGQSNTNTSPLLSLSVPNTRMSEGRLMADTAVAMAPIGIKYPKTPSSHSCNCLQKHAELLGNPILAETRARDGLDDGIWSIDKALLLAEQAMTAWHGLITCTYCPYDSEQEVTLLAFMSIRAVTQYLQRLAPRYAMSNPLVREPNSPQSPLDDSRLQIGFFQLEGNDRMLVLRLLYLNTIQKIKRVLQALQMIQNRKKSQLLDKTQNKMAGIDDYQASSNWFHIQQISHGLVTSLQALEASLNGK